MPRASFVVVVLAFAATVSCASEQSQDPERLGQVSSRFTGMVCAGGASGVVVSPTWSSTLTGSFFHLTDLGLSVTNRFDEEVSVDVKIRATGLGGRTVSKDLYSFGISGNDRRDVPVTLDDVPLRTTDEPVEAEIVVTVVAPRDYAGVEVVSRPLFIRARDIDYRDFELFGEERPASPVITEPATFASATTDIQRAVEALSSTPTGEYFDEARGTWHDVSNLPTPHSDAHVVNRDLVLTSHDSLVLGGVFQITPAPVVDGDYAPVYVCGNWQASYIDDIGGTWIPHDAAYAQAWIGHLLTAAQTKYGVNDPRTVAFSGTGDTYGVDF